MILGWRTSLLSPKPLGQMERLTTGLEEELARSPLPTGAEAASLFAAEAALV